MEEPDLEIFESGEEVETEPDSALGNSQSIKSEDSGSAFLETTAKTESDITCDCSAISSVTQQKEDLFDQLFDHFNKRSNSNLKEERGRSRKRPTSVGYFNTGSLIRRRTLSSQHTIARPRSSHGNSYSTLPIRVPTPVTSLYVRQTSTPESSSNNFDQSSNVSSSDLGVSRIRTISQSSTELVKTKNDERKNEISSTESKSELDSTKSEPKSISLLNLEDLKLKPVNMLRAHARRSMTPDITSQRRHGRAEWSSPHLNGLLSPSGSRNSLDRMTADSIDRRRIRRRTSDKFNDTIMSVGQLANTPRRARSALGNASRDSDQWSMGSSFNTGSDAKPSVSNKNATDKNGKPLLRDTLPRDWTPSCDVASSSNHDVTVSSSVSSDKVTPVSSSSVINGAESDESKSSSSFEEFDANQLRDMNEPQSRSQSALDIALNEDHDSIMRLAKIREDQFTMKLISAMKELKDIAEVARIIDEVDDEEWLLVFVGELDHRLRYLMKLEEEEDEPEDHEANIREKATILDVALDLISFLKDRSGYRRHSRYSIASNDNCTPTHGSDVIEDGNATIQRMRKMAEAKPPNPYEMEKWQRQLFNLAGTLDKYITVLQKDKESTAAKPRPLPRNDVTKSPSYDTNERRYQGVVSELKRNNRAQSKPTKQGVNGHRDAESNPNSNSNNNNNNNNDNIDSNQVTSQAVWTLPVLDLRQTSQPNNVLNHIGQAAFIQDRRGMFSPNSLDGERFLNDDPFESVHPDKAAPRVTRSHHGTPTPHSRRNHQRDPILSTPRSDSRSSSISPVKTPKSNPTSPTKAVVSAYCRFPESSRRRSASVSSDSESKRNHQKTEFRISVGTDVGKNQGDAPFRRTRSTDSRQKTVNPPEFTSQRNSSSSSTGARPKVRPPPQTDSKKRKSTRSDSSSSSSSDNSRLRHQRPVTSSSSTQCDLDLGLRQREKNSEEKLKQMKRRADLLKTGLEEARQERDEKERKIAVLQARLDRMKKNLVAGESEKGAVEEEMDRLNKLLKEKTVESAEEIAVLKRRLEELEKQLEKEKRRYERMNGTVEDLTQQLLASQRRCEEMAGGKEELEQRIHDLTMALMYERKHGAQLQEDNTRLETELEDANRRLARSDKEREELRQAQGKSNSELEKKLERQRHLAEEMVAGKAGAEQKAEELEGHLKNAEDRIEQLEEENQKLSEEVEYLNQELKVNEDMKNAQKEQYDKEISRLLSENASKPDETAVSEAKEEADRERMRAEELEKEHEKLKNEQQELIDAKGAKANASSSTEDKSTQADDMSFTRMRAFDWYSSRAQQDARRLREQGWQMELETRKKIKQARDAMRELNYSIIKERSTSLPRVLQGHNH